MILTGHELEIVPSAVAAIAIVGALVGSRMSSKSTLKAVELSNSNALEIAREERSSRDKRELETHKRLAYADCLAKLGALYQASVALNAGAKSSPNPIGSPAKYVDRLEAANSSVSSLMLIAPPRIGAHAWQAFVTASHAVLDLTVSYSESYSNIVTRLTLLMWQDLADEELPDEKALDELSDYIKKAVSPEQ
jgi:hypothetical protein